jgi:hypothetical protein
MWSSLPFIGESPWRMQSCQVLSDGQDTVKTASNTTAPHAQALIKWHSVYTDGCCSLKQVVCLSMDGADIDDRDCASNHARFVV